MIVNEKDIITLNNCEKYLVILKVEKNNDAYYYIAQLSDDEKNIVDNYKIVSIVNKTDEYVIDEILGEEKLKEILPMFLEKTK